MPYTAEHKRETRERIVEAARRLFNRKGFAEVSIDEIMAAAGLTRGGFYNHFSTKDELFVAAIEAFASCGNPTEHWDGPKIDVSLRGRPLARQLVDAYLSREHLENVEAHCPMIALPSDVARAGPTARAAYRRLLEFMIDILEAGVEGRDGLAPREQAMAIAALCIGGMVLARTFDDAAFANEIREAARKTALILGAWTAEHARDGDGARPGGGGRGNGQAGDDARSPKNGGGAWE